MDIRNESTPHAAGVHYGRFLGQIMGWDSHGDPKTLGGRVANWMSGGRHRKAQAMGGDLYSTIENPDKITEVIQRAKDDGVFQTSTYNACYGAIKHLADEYNPSNKINDPKFMSHLLHNILGKCHSSMGLDYKNCEIFYHWVVGTQPAVKNELSAAYDKDPNSLKDWTALASSTHKPHPTFNPTDRTAIYWHIESDNMIGPLNLIKKLINDAPNEALSLPKNTDDLYNMSVEFAQAYFPHIINKRRGGGGGAPSSSSPSTSTLGTTLPDLISALQHFTGSGNPSDIDKSKGDNSASTGKKADLIAALSNIIGPTAMASITPDSNSLLAIMKDHNSFFGMHQLLEQEKLN